jgi:hypothetical protein
MELLFITLMVIYLGFMAGVAFTSGAALAFKHHGAKLMVIKIEDDETDAAP